MRVLFMGSPGSRTDEIARRLADGGHDVVTCHDRGRPPFPCKGVRGRCPLDGGAIDVAFLVRDHVWPRPTLFDRGATCAIRQRVPLVLQGSEVLNPYEAWTGAVVSPAGDPLPALERVAHQVRPVHSTVATEALRACLEAEGARPRCIAEVRYRNGRLEVRAWVPESMPAMKRQNTAARVAGALRRFDRHAAGIDVSFEPVKTDPTFVTTPSRTR